MPSAAYLKNKENIFNWREKHPESWAILHNQQNKRYYEKNKEKIRKYNRNLATYKREAKVFREILVSSL